MRSFIAFPKDHPTTTAYASFVRLALIRATTVSAEERAQNPQVNFEEWAAQIQADLENIETNGLVVMQGPDGKPFMHGAATPVLSQTTGVLPEA